MLPIENALVSLPIENIAAPTSVAPQEIDLFSSQFENLIAFYEKQDIAEIIPSTITQNLNDEVLADCTIVDNKIEDLSKEIIVNIVENIKKELPFQENPPLSSPTLEEPEIEEDPETKLESIEKENNIPLFFYHEEIEKPIQTEIKTERQNINQQETSHLIFSKKTLPNDQSVADIQSDMNQSVETKNTTEQSFAFYSSADRQTITTNNNTQPPLLEAEKTIRFDTDENFGYNLSNNIQILIKSNQSQAKLNLSPADLGTMEIDISQVDNKTNIMFIVSQEATIELVNKNLAPLINDLEQNGLSLGEVLVSHRESNQNEKQQQTHKSTYSNSETVQSENEIKSDIVLENITSSQLLDLYV